MINYIEPQLLGGKKRKKMIFFVVFIAIFSIFVTFFKIFLTISNFSLHFYPTTDFYFVSLPLEDSATQLQQLASRGAGSVKIENEVALALFSSFDTAKNVQQNLVETTNIRKMSTPKLSIDSLTQEKQILATKMYDYFVSTLTLLCEDTIELDSHKIDEHDFRVTLDIHLTNLTTFFENNYLSFDQSLTPFYNLLSLSISELRFLLTTTAYTENLTPYISVVRFVTLNLLFSSLSINSVEN